jgi:hypothetical protein
VIYPNPVTLQAALEPDESVLVLGRAVVGALVGTSHRVLVIKRGDVHAFDYGEIEDIRLDRHGRFLVSAVCQLVTQDRPYHEMNSKEAEGASTNALSVGRAFIPLFERACTFLIEIRDKRRCPACGRFVPILDIERRVRGREDGLMFALGWGEGELVARNLRDGEVVLCQVHGRRYAKGMVVTDRRVLVVLGRTVHSFEMSQVAGVELRPDHLMLRIVGRPDSDSGGSKVRDDNKVPFDNPEMLTFESVANVIRKAIVRQSHRPI